MRFAFAMVGKASITVSFSIVNLYSTEILPTVVRNAGMGICMLAANIGSISAAYLIELVSGLGFSIPLARTT